jgi:hypothetical protein
MVSFSLVENQTAREDSPPRHQGKTHREVREVREESQASGVRCQACGGDLALIPHLSSIIRNSNREAREVREESQA